jgi:hypothetical protein
MNARSKKTNCRAILLICLCLGYCAVASAQTSKTIIQKLTLYKYPVVTSFELKGEPLKFKETIDTNEGWRRFEFEAADDWLNELTVKITNVSDKPITYLNLNLHFPEVTKNGRSALHQIFIGVDPDRKFLRPELHLKPKETLAIPLSEHYLAIKSLADTVAKFAVENVTTVWVEFHAALFDDGTLFEVGIMFRRNSDATDARKWIPIDKP